MGTPLAAPIGRSGVSLQSLQATEPGGIRSQTRGRPAIADRQPGLHPEEAERAGAASRSPGGEDVVGSCAVVPHHLRGPLADEQRAIVPQAAGSEMERR